MTQTDAMAFRRKFSESVRKAQTGPVEITRNGRRDLVLMSADHYDWLRAAAQRTHGPKMPSPSWSKPCNAPKWIRCLPISTN
jgi:prevent-host-death family protein